MGVQGQGQGWCLWVAAVPAGAPAAAPALTGGEAPPGSQALAQALRTGDVGDPLFGRKGKSNRPVWNIESLRTKDETGA